MKKTDGDEGKKKQNNEAKSNMKTLKQKLKETNGRNVFLIDFKLFFKIMVVPTGPDIYFGAPYAKY